MIYEKVLLYSLAQGRGYFGVKMTGIIKRGQQSIPRGASNDPLPPRKKNFRTKINPQKIHASLSDRTTWPAYTLGISRLRWELFPIWSTILHFQHSWAEFEHFFAVWTTFRHFFFTIFHMFNNSCSYMVMHCPYGSVLLWECFRNYADLTVEELDLVDLGFIS